jgi:hypothetical protein
LEFDWEKENHLNKKGKRSMTHPTPKLEGIFLNVLACASQIESIAREKNEESTTEKISCSCWTKTQENKILSINFTIKK